MTNIFNIYLGQGTIHPTHLTFKNVLAELHIDPSGSKASSFFTNLDMEIDTTVQFYYFSVHKNKLQEDNNLLD